MEKRKLDGSVTVLTEDENLGTELHRVIVERIWNAFKHELVDHGNFDSFAELQKEVNGIFLATGPGVYWATRHSEQRPFEPGNLKLQDVEYEKDLAGVLLPAIQVTESTPQEDRW